MRLFDIFKNKKSKAVSIEELISMKYSEQYSDECKYIWKNYVPKRGQANCLQGELLREIEKIRYEAQDNGNINWDEDYSYFCDFISKSLLEQNIFSEEEKQEIVAIMTHLKDCGFYAKKVYDGVISDEEADPNKIAYTEDNLYDIICDKIGRLQSEHPEPIPYNVNEDIRR